MNVFLRNARARNGHVEATLNHPFPAQVRFAVSAVILFYGCRWLCYTVSLSDLLLNAVALEFVISVDDLIFEALAPKAAKARVERLRPLRRTAARASRGVGGVDGETLVTNAFVATLVAYFVALELGPQTRILKHARDAICGGDQDFVFTTDGAGVPAWGFPETVDDPHFSRDVNFGDLYGAQDKRTYLQRSVESSSSMAASTSSTAPSTPATSGTTTSTSPCSASGTTARRAASRSASGSRPSTRASSPSSRRARSAPRTRRGSGTRRATTPCPSTAATAT